MYATIWCDAPVAATHEESALAGRALAVRLRALPGFVAYVALAAESGDVAAICICADEQSLAAAHDLIAQAGAAQHAGQDAGPVPMRTGEVIVQKGL